jgi:predicted nucleic acid-binding protein
MPDRLMVDTDVLIDYLRGQAEAVNYLEGLAGPLLVSAISVAELFAGVREGSERMALEAFIAAFDLVPVNELIATKGGLYQRDYGKSHGVGLPDALIAAAAELNSATLVSLNRKHFPMLDTVLVPYQKP